MYFNFDMPSTLWAKRVRTFNVKFSASNKIQIYYSRKWGDYPQSWKWGDDSYDDIYSL